MKVSRGQLNLLILLSQKERKEVDLFTLGSLEAQCSRSYEFALPEMRLAIPSDFSPRARDRNRFISS